MKTIEQNINHCPQNDIIKTRKKNYKGNVAGWVIIKANG